jgi:hypothetical protein
MISDHPNAAITQPTATHDPTQNKAHHKLGVSSTGAFHPELEYPDKYRHSRPKGITTVYAYRSRIKIEFIIIIGARSHLEPVEDGVEKKECVNNSRNLTWIQKPDDEDIDGICPPSSLYSFHPPKR